MTPDKKQGLTLIELVIAIAISILISTVLYFSLNSALGTWQLTQDRLLLQQVSSQLMEQLAEGLPDTYGLRDALELIDCSSYHIKVVMPWTDDTHEVYSGISTYTLNKHIKPGTSIPIAEALLPEAKEYKVVPISFVDSGKSDDYPKVRLELDIQPGALLRFTFHPDYRRDADVLTTFRYDAGEQAVFIDDKDGSRNISQNPFGVKITDFILRYFDNTNAQLGASSSDLPVITGIEIAFKTESRNGNVRETVTFISLRNAPMHSGNLILREGKTIPIPNSKEIQVFFLSNLSGIDNNDTLVLDAISNAGKDWRVNLHFYKPSVLGPAVIGLYSIEYPIGNKIYSERPNTPAVLGFNLLNLSPNGLYDYDDDRMQDRVLLEGKVVLEVKKMDITGASVFVKP